MKQKTIRLILFVMMSLVFISGCKTLTELSLVDIEQKIFQMVNDHRASRGLAPLEWNGIIATECRDHSENMAKGTIPVGHDGFNQRFEDIRDQIPSAYSCAENVAFLSGYTDPAEYIFDGWLSNSSHRENIEGDFGLTAVGVIKDSSDGYYFTQIFIKTK